MTSRSRPRGTQLKDDADEERSIWNQLRADAKKVDALVRESNEIEKRIYELGVAQQAIEVSTVGDRHRLSVGTEVFYRNKQKNTEGEGILCSVTSVIGEGKQRRYEIIDSDPDPSTPLQPYRASVSNLVPIPVSNAGLTELPLRKNVLAVYPGTTTFYKAEVVASRAGKGLKKDGKEIGGSLGELKDGFVRLRFEGEDEADREMDVERRYVLPETGR
ncbi:hypothetical protein BK809_0007883 [Diplodia seriata]|uniref:SGF29 C-terminal domain-containing protein n=1 Tax=Diplodia seriata TaxID=420778 RepID=A0A1S8BKM2_9PEZI|nr:hypothetical protein BK809_0007883 [Diplodia seriata]